MAISWRSSRSSGLPQGGVPEDPGYAVLPSVLGDRLLHALLPHVSDSLIHAILAFDTPLDAGRLARAVALMFQQNPILGCRMAAGYWGMKWQATGDAAERALSWETLDGERSVESALEGYLVKPALPDQHPLVQVHRIRGRGETLCIKVQHVIADAGAAKQIAYRLAEIYSRLEENESYTPPVVDTPRGFGPLLRDLGIRPIPGMLRRNWRNLRNLSSPSRNGRLPLDPGESGRFFIQRRLNALPLKAFGKRHDATLNDLALSAALRAFEGLAEFPPDTPRRIVNTVDLRRYLRDPEAINTCNLSAFCYLNLGVKPGGNFVDTLDKVRNEMRFQKGDYLGIGELPSWLLLAPQPFAWLRAIGRHAFDPAKRGIPPALTNMGRFDGERLKFADQMPCHAWTTAPVVFPPAVVIGLSGFRDTLTFSLGGSGGAGNRDQCEQLLGRIAGELEAAAVAERWVE